MPSSSCAVCLLQASVLAAGEACGGLGALGGPAVSVHLQPPGVRPELGVLHAAAAGLRRPTSFLTSDWSGAADDHYRSIEPLGMTPGGGGLIGGLIGVWFLKGDGVAWET